MYEPGLSGRVTDSVLKPDSSFVETCTAIRLVEKLNGMPDLECLVCQQSARANLHVTPGVSCCQNLCTSLLDCRQLLSKHFLGHFTLNQIIDTCSPTAPLSSGKRHQIQLGNVAQCV